jgi:SAM-dependent methyltransferase
MSLKQNIASFIRKQSFSPGIAGLFVNPFYFLRKELYKNVRDLAPQLSGKLLDFGCGRKPYEQLFSVERYIGIDMEQTGHEHTLSKVDVFYDGKTIPFANEYFDSVFCSEVFEHVFNLHEVIKEIKRVLKPGGKILVTVPLCWNEHEAPYDFGRYTSYGIRHILETNGFEVIELRKSGNFFKVNMQLWALYFHNTINVQPKALAFLLRMLFIVPVNILGATIAPLFPKNNSLYFNNVVIAKKA